MIKVQATNDLIRSQNIPASEEGARTLLSRGNQGHTNPVTLYLPYSLREDGREDIRSKPQLVKDSCLYDPVEVLQQVGGDCICLIRAPHVLTILVTSILSLSTAVPFTLEVSWFGQMTLYR